MNLFDAIQQWLETTIIKPITDRLARQDKEIEVLGQRVVKLENPAVQIQQPTGDLSFLAQRIHTLEKRVEAFVQRLQSVENTAIDLDAVRRLIDDELEGDSFRDRLDDAIRAQIQASDSVREEIKDICKEFLDNELDDLQIEIKRG